MEDEFITTEKIVKSSLKVAIQLKSLKLSSELLVHYQAIEVSKSFHFKLHDKHKHFQQFIEFIFENSMNTFCLISDGDEAKR